jgi:hypothetical protein
MPTKSNIWLSVAIALLGAGLLSNAALQLSDHAGGLSSRAAWGQDVHLITGAGRGHSGIDAFPVQMGRGMYGFVLLDPARHSLAVYRVVGSVSRLRLIAARNYRYDLQLQDFNNSAPTPAQVKKLLRAGKH